LRNVACLEREILASSEDVPASGLFTQVFSHSHGGVEAYNAFCADAIYSGAEHPLWVASWLDNVGDRCLVVVIWKDRQPSLALALEVLRFGPVTVAAFAGATHANSSFPAITPHALDYEDILRAMIDLGEARPDIDAIVLERQRPELEGYANPLLKLRHIASPNLALAMDLERCRRTGILGSRRKMKRHRNVRRRLEMAGDIKIFRASTETEVDNLFSHFLRWKEARFAAQGVGNVFETLNVQESFRKLFHAALREHQPSFTLYGLEVSGKLRAVNGYSRSAEGLLCEFMGYCEDELAPFSPGEFLTYEVVAEACARGDSIYDFGVGDEPYKRAWCDLERNQVDIYLGLTPRGKMFAFSTVGISLLKRAIKRNSLANELLRRARRLTSPLSRTC
jgi:CelD/BcsL family acetyltransferase involved in cellulose biosynthesis